MVFMQCIVFKLIDHRLFSSCCSSDVDLFELVNLNKRDISAICAIAT